MFSFGLMRIAATKALHLKNKMSLITTALSVEINDKLTLLKFQTG